MSKNENGVGVLDPPATSDVTDGVFAALNRTMEAALDVRELCNRFELVRPDLTRMVGVSLRTIDKWAAGERIAPKPKRRLAETERLLKALGEIMEPEAVGEWLHTSNPAFAGSTPLQVIERGEADRIWRMIYLVETGEPV